MNIAAARNGWSKDLTFVKAYEALADEFAALGELVRVRQLAEMSQADVAASISIAQASVARLEFSVGGRKDAPSIATLRRHADAIVKMSPVRVPHKLPVVLSREEVARLIERAGNDNYRAALSVAYGAGRRISEE